VKEGKELNEKEKEHLPVEKAAISPLSKHENGNSLYVDCVLEAALTGWDNGICHLRQ